MISILIPTYNYDIFHLVEQIHAQGIHAAVPFEIVVVDDGSINFSLENESITQLSNTRYLYLDENIGRTAAREKLAQLAKYNWLLFLDSDVMPTEESFIQKYVDSIKKKKYNVVFGGITYQKERPAPNMVLRWHYGRSREAKSVSEREKSPYFIISQNLLIEKETFLEANTIKENYYGLDNFFSNQLQRLSKTVGHIDNPVLHLGLEPNDKFISKALNAVKTTVIFENKGLMDADSRPIQKSYLKLKKIRLTKVFSFIISKFKTKMHRNFHSERPNLFWFDLYRLAYYIDLKSDKNA
jgi:GT2 family glycosyltransferase